MFERGRLSSRLSARETSHAQRRRRGGAGGRKPRPGKGRGFGAHAQNQSTGQAVPPNGFAEERRARGARTAHAVASPRPQAGARARPAQYLLLQTRPLLYFNQRRTGESREVWGEVGGASHGERGQQKEGRGEIQDSVTA